VNECSAISRNGPDRCVSHASATQAYQAHDHGPGKACSDAAEPLCVHQAAGGEVIRRLWLRWMVWNMELYATALEREGIDAFNVRREVGALRVKLAVV